MKANGDLAIMIGWNAERMAREGKSMKPMHKYLEAPKPKTAESGGQDVRRMFDRMIRKQGEQHGAR